MPPPEEKEYQVFRNLAKKEVPDKVTALLFLADATDICCKKVDKKWIVWEQPTCSLEVPEEE